MAETGVIGYSKIAQNIKVFWSNFILTKNDTNNLYLSTISDRVFLINYDTEDKVRTKSVKDNSILSMRDFRKIEK